MYNFSSFQRNMSRNRFLQILSFLHFSPNPKADDSSYGDHICKIRFIKNYLDSRMDEIYYPDKKVCVDESMVQWRDRLSFRQYIKRKKQNKFGINRE